MRPQISVTLLGPTSVIIAYVTGVANTGAMDTSTPVPTSLTTEAYVSMSPGVTTSDTMFTG